MAVYFVDSSGIVKRYASEVGSAWIIGITDPATGNEIFVSRITEKGTLGTRLVL